MRSATPGTFGEAFAQIVARPRFRGARFGIAIFALDGEEPIFAHDADTLFACASVTKIPTCANALEALGPNYCFRTPVLRFGTVDGNGTLNGDLVLVASGDPNLSNRIAADGTLVFNDVDHSLGDAPGARPVPGDPLAVLRALSAGVTESGIRRIAGTARIDISLFEEAGRELGTGVAISPISVNDNVVDVEVIPAERIGDPAELRFSPAAPCLAFANKTRTIASGKSTLRFVDSDVARDPAIVVVSGDAPAGVPFWTCYCVPHPRRFAESLFRQTLEEAGIIFDGAGRTDAPHTGIEVASHQSPPLSEAVKICLKVSQNLHAELLVRAVGAASGSDGDARSAGFVRERALLEKAGLEVASIAQGDGAGGIGYFTPRSICRLLQYVARRPYAAAFREALPILGGDGTLHDIQTASAAAGHVRAKTGTLCYTDDLNATDFVTAKGLAGYIDARSGLRYVFTTVVNNVHCSPDGGVHEIGETLGEIGAAAYELL